MDRNAELAGQESSNSLSRSPLKRTLGDIWGNYANAFRAIYEMLEKKKPASMPILMKFRTLSSKVGSTEQFTLPEPRDDADRALLSAFNSLVPQIELKLGRLQKIASDNPLIEGQDWPVEVSTEWARLLVELNTIFTTWLNLVAIDKSTHPEPFKLV